MDWLLKPLTVAIISAACFQAGVQQGAIYVQEEWYKKEVDAIKHRITNYYKVKLLEEEIVKLKRDCKITTSKLPAP